MLKKLFSYVGEYKKESILAPILIAMEVLIEISIPFLMASIIDNGLSKSNMNHIFFMGGISFLLATVSMISGIGAGKYAARAAAGFSKNIRKALFYKIQKYSFTNIDKFSTAGLITRFTTDINNIQNSYQMIIRIFVRAPFMMVFATIMAVYISPSLSLIYIVAVIFLGIMVAIIFSKVHPIFTRAVKKYDKMVCALYLLVK